LPPVPETKKPAKLTREGVMERLAKGEDFEKLNLKDLDLAGLNFENKSFRGANLQGVRFYSAEEGAEERITNLKGVDFTDTTIADEKGSSIFVAVQAQGAKFGVTKSLVERRLEQQKSGKIPTAHEIGGLHSFIGNDGNFTKTIWQNIDFGGNTGIEALFKGADLSEAVMKGCDLAGLDLSESKIDGIKIIDNISFRGLKINEKQVEALIKSIQIKNEFTYDEFVQERETKGLEKAVAEFIKAFEIIVVKIKE